MWMWTEGDLGEVWVHAQNEQEGMEELICMKRTITTKEGIEYESVLKQELNKREKK